jgi:putative ABC transport system permease protein
MRTTLSDLRYAMRVLSRTPSFSIAVILVLTLGIGANTAIFSIVNAVLLRPLPFDRPDELVRLFHEPPQSAFPGIHRFSVSPANFYDWQHDARAFEGMAIYRFRQFTLTGAGEPQAVLAGAVGAGFFHVVRAQPLLGRVFADDEDTPARSHVVILSEGFWKSHFGAAPDIVGRALTLDGDAYTVVGVMPARFSMASWAVTARDMWVPVAYTDEQRAVRENHNAQVIARLRPGVNASEAQAEMDVISKRLEAQYPQANTGWGAVVVPLQEVLVGDMRSSLVMLLVAVGLVLLIACANVGNLLFARSLARRKEIAIRSALGAGRARVFQQLLVESLLLAVVGGVSGLLIAHIGLDTSAALLANQIPRADEISIDGRVLLFTLIASVVTGVLAGAMPALRAGRTELNEALKEGGRADGAVGIRTRRVLIVCEVGLSVVLLMGATVMIRSLMALRNVDAGFSSERVLTLRVTLPQTRYKTGTEIGSFYHRALERLRAVPGIASASAVDDLPVTGGSVQPIVLEGRPELLPRDQPTVEVRKVAPGYFRTMDIPLMRGRDVAYGDVEVMLVSRGAAKLLWGDADPVGQRVRLPLESRTTLKQVIGIVGDVKQGELSQPAAPTVYEFTREPQWNGMVFVLEASLPPLSVAQSAIAAIHEIDPLQPVEDVRTMQAVVDETLVSQRFSALLLGVFAAVALALAAVGIYSVLSYIVRGRSREIGIRTALGAQTTDVVRLVVLEGMTPAAVGIAVGAAGTMLTARLLQKLAFGVSASDPATLAAVAGTLAVVALLASIVPAYRASRLDPLNVLRAN